VSNTCDWLTNVNKLFFLIYSTWLLLLKTFVELYGLFVCWCVIRNYCRSTNVAHHHPT